MNGQHLVNIFDIQYKDEGWVLINKSVLIRISKDKNLEMIYSNDPDLENALIYLLNHQEIPSMNQEKIDKILK